MGKCFDLLGDLISNNAEFLQDSMMKAITREEAMLVTFINPLSVGIMKNDDEYRLMLSRFDFIFVDGMLLAKALTKTTGEVVRRLSFDGNSLAPSVFHFCEEKRLNVAFIGGVDGVALTAAEKIMKNYSLDVTYTHNGFFSSNDLDREIIKIINLKVKLIVVGMGAPYQEQFSIRAKELGFKGVIFTCGGYFDQIVDSGEVYYPYLINKLNLRALYRTMKEPKRLIPRYTVGYWPFYVEYLALGFRR